MSTPTSYPSRRRRPHRELPGAVYFVSWRLHRRQRPLTAAERTLVVATLRHFDGARYRLDAFVVMDDHVHVLVQPFEGHRLRTVLHSWKSYTANRLQRIYQRRGAVWQGESFDRIMRNREIAWRAACYIQANPRQRWPEQANYPWVWVAAHLG